MKGYVYFLHSDHGTKIGMTNSIEVRLYTLNVLLPFPVEMIHKVLVSDSCKAEKILQGHFHEKRINGEWYKLDEADITFIKTLECESQILQLKNNKPPLAKKTWRKNTDISIEKSADELYVHLYKAQVMARDLFLLSRSDPSVSPAFEDYSRKVYEVFSSFPDVHKKEG